MTQQKTELYPLLPGQALMVFAEKWCLKKTSVNICASVHFDFELDASLLLQALYLALLRNQATRIRLTKLNKEVRMYFTDESPNSIEVVDMSDKSDEEVDAQMEAWSKVPFPHGRMNVQLYSARLVKKSNNRYALLIIVHHTVMDTYALMYMAEDILKIYRALSSGEKLPENKNQTMQMYNAEMERLSKNTDKLEAQKAFWRDEVFAEEPRYLSVNGTGNVRKEFVKGKNYGKSNDILHPKSLHLNLPIEKETIDELKEFCSANRIPELVVYMLAISSYLSSANDYYEDVLLMSAIAKRATVLEKHAGMTKADNMFYRVNIPHETSFLEACRQQSLIQNRYLRNSEVSFTDANKLMQEKFNMPEGVNYTQISVTVQPYFINTPPDMPIHLKRHCNGAIQQPLYLTIIATDNSGAMTCNYEYSCSLVDPNNLQAMHKHIVNFLKTATKNPELTLGELAHSCSAQ